MRRKREDILRIWKDPAMGALGGTGLVLLVAGQFAAIVTVPTAPLLPALFGTAVNSRRAQVVVVHKAAPAYEKSTAKPFIDELGWPHFLAATAATCAVSCFTLRRA